MSKRFIVRDKLLSLRGRIEVTDAEDFLAYEAVGEFALFRPTWRVYRDGTEVATITRRLFSWSPSWDITSQLGNFTITRKLFSWTRGYSVSSGNLADLRISGSLWDMSFEILRGEKLIAAARGKWMSLRNAQVIELLSSEPANELLTIIAMMLLHLDRKHEAGLAADSGD